MIANTVISKYNYFHFVAFVTDNEKQFHSFIKEYAHDREGLK